MRLALLGLVAVPFISGATIVPRPDYRCVAEESVGAYFEDGIHPTRYKTQHEYFLMHISNIPEKVLTDIHKNALAFDAPEFEHFPVDTASNIRESLNHIASSWDPNIAFTYIPEFEHAHLVKQKLKGVYFIRRSDENPNDARHYNFYNVCQYRVDYTDNEALACYMMQHRESFVVGFNMLKFEYSKIGTWLDWKPSASSNERPDSSYFEFGTCEPYYR